MNMERLANSVSLIVAGRLGIVLGVPAILAMIGWAGTELNDLGKALAATRVAIDGQQRQIDNHEVRINRLEQRYFVAPPVK